MAVRVRLVTQGTTRNFPTNLSLWVALFSLEYHIVVRAESEMAAFALERKQLSTVFTLGTTGSFQVEPNSESNTRAELGTDFSQLASVSGTGLFALWWNRGQGRVGVSVDSFEAK